MLRRRGQLGGLLSLAAGVALCACGNSDEPPGPATLAPPDAPLYAEVDLEPGEQTDALIAMVERVGGIDDPEGRLEAEVNRGLAPDGVSYEDDIEPWIGSRAGLFVRSFEPSKLAGGSPDLAVAVEANDAEAAREFVDSSSEDDGEENRTYEEVEYLYSPEERIAVGIVGEYLVFGTEPSFKVAVDSFTGESLAGSDEFQRRTAALEGDRLATMFFEPGAALEAALMAEDLASDQRRLLRPLLSGALREPMAVGVSIADESASLEVVAAYAEAREPATLPITALPAGSWVAATAPDLGPALTRLLDGIERGGLPGSRSLAREVRERTGIDPRRDVLSWLHGAAGFVEGTGAPGVTAGVIAETTDPRGPRRLLAVVRDLAEREFGLRAAAAPSGSSAGFTLGAPALGGGVEAGVEDDRVALVIGGTVAGAVAPEETLADDERYAAAAAALGDEFEPNFFMHLPSTLAVAALGDPADDDYRVAEPYVAKLDSLLAGVRFADEQVVSRWTLTLAPQ